MMSRSRSFPIAITLVIAILCFRAPADRPEEWQVILRLIGIIQGKGAAADINQIDDELLMDDLRRTAGPFAEMVFKAGSQRRGAERLLDLGLRAGPYGDQFGMKPDGLNLDKVQSGGKWNRSWRARTARTGSAANAFGKN